MIKHFEFLRYGLVCGDLGQVYASVLKVRTVVLEMESLLGRLNLLETALTHLATLVGATFEFY